jgi:peroxiredoxin
MIDEGAGAPAFELPAVIGGDIEQVALSDYLGSDVVILAFYPADFNPACDGETTDLDELDLFTMQKDVSILAVSADSVYSHQAFAEEYDLHIPLLADTAGEVAADYGVAVDDPEAGYRTKRAVIVIGPGGDVEYAWSTDDL